MKTLVVAEKPSVAESLAKVLKADQKNRHYYEGKDYIVTWALGHLMTLKMPEDYKKEWQTWTFDTLPLLPKQMETKPLPKTRAQLRAIQTLGKRSDIKEAVIATDAGREGELVARWILEYIRFNRPVKRLWISSQTDKAIKDGFAHLRPAKDYDNLYSAAKARATADWLIGLNVTRALTVKYNDNLSAGRVQTPTLGLVAKQEALINQFKPQTYYTLSFVTKHGDAQMQGNPRLTLEKAQALQLELQDETAVVTEIKAKNKRQKAPLPYDLTELQKDANQRYQFSAKKTLNLLQTLYEQYKVVTYPRTDSKYLTSDLKNTMQERLIAISRYEPQAKKLAAKKAPVLQQQVFNDAKVGDHYGLIPTEQMPQAERFSNDEQKIYNLIVERFIGLFLPDYQEAQQQYSLRLKTTTFVLKVTQVTVAGFKQVELTPQNITKFNKGTVMAGKLTLNKQLTQAPKPLSEATLLVQMEKDGLGTPATRAEIIEKIISTGLMERTGRHVKVTPKGNQLLKLVNPSLTSPKLTAQWETELEQIAAGQLSQQKFVTQIRDATVDLVKEVKNSSADYKDFNLTAKVCPKCGAHLREKQTRNGVLLVCSNQNCDYYRRRDPKVTNHRCPQCHKKMILLTGEKGDYFKCTNCNLTQKVTDIKKHKKMSKHEETQLLKKVNADDEPQESPLAQALKAAMARK
ncbi:DNA topoisomerase III [Loigolactobacillus backii]|uniref:DNA topoisomerase 3 n=1 Tax=Loigolactobacillus backii TaxID=375175 RepID=UPI000C1CB211|nr:DNA topoisomerase 3 [Loigolactobacillus backii]PIO83920.1 DNA topoisomerase III [Loigolactobacillus backii]